jgi:L-alanine-DL-glutamate epimerase-like enolase superfamily enzyme
MRLTKESRISRNQISCSLYGMQTARLTTADVCKYVNVPACMYVNVPACVYVNVHVCARVCACVRGHVWVLVNVPACDTYVHIFVCVCM